jgi:hypothetical protein
MQETSMKQVANRLHGITVKHRSIVPGSVVQFLWSLSESYFNYAPTSTVFPDPLFLFQTPDENDEQRFHCISQKIELFTYVTLPLHAKINK